MVVTGSRQAKSRHTNAVARPSFGRIGAMRQEGAAATAFVCRDFACREPVTSPEALAAQLVSPA